MGSNRTGEVNCKMYSEDREMLMKSKKAIEHISSGGYVNETPASKSRQGSQSPEYVKRTAKLFESVKITEEVEEKNGLSSKSEQEGSSYITETRERIKISLDSLDGDYTKKPSYLGVSCSNSGYRNVINYDSKLREGFWVANSQRESLVLTSSRLRENSPMRRDFDLKTQNGTDGESIKTTRNIPIERTECVPLNGVSQPEKFVNISTSTKTISTFRNSKDKKENDIENNVNGDLEPKSNPEMKVNLKQILNCKNDETSRKGYSNLGFSPKILKSPERNCNSFLKSISSFENNCKKSQGSRSATYSRTEQTVYDSNNSIQQRIERLYGPGALAHGFLKQKTKFSDKTDDCSSDCEITSSNNKPHTSIITITNTNGNSLSKSIPEVSSTEQCSSSHVVERPEFQEADTEKNGHYFLKLLKKETDHLERLASFAESELENGENLPEDISGKLRAAAGKARLLVCQKLQQFEGLCQKNLSEKPGEEFPTTNEDLAGFWDMVMLQVVQVYGVFDEIDELKRNNWKPSPKKKEPASSPASHGQSPSAKTTSKKSTPTSSERQSQKSEATKKASEERRKLLEERRKKMKKLKENKVLNNDNEVEIFAK